MFCNKEESQVEMSRKIVLWQIFIGHRSVCFPLLSAMGAVDIQLNNSFIERPITHDYTDPSNSLGASRICAADGYLRVNFRLQRRL